MFGDELILLPVTVEEMQGWGRVLLPGARVLYMKARNGITSITSDPAKLEPIFRRANACSIATSLLVNLDFLRVL